MLVSAPIVRVVSMIPTAKQNKYLMSPTSVSTRDLWVAYYSSKGGRSKDDNKALKQNIKAIKRQRNLYCRCAFHPQGFVGFPDV